MMTRIEDYIVNFRAHVLFKLLRKLGLHCSFEQVLEELALSKNDHEVIKSIKKLYSSRWNRFKVSISRLLRIT